MADRQKGSRVVNSSNNAQRPELAVTATRLNANSIHALISLYPVCAVHIEVHISDDLSRVSYMVLL